MPRRSTRAPKSGGTLDVIETEFESEYGVYPDANHHVAPSQPAPVARKTPWVVWVFIQALRGGMRLGVSLIRIVLLLHLVIYIYLIIGLGLNVEETFTVFRAFWSMCSQWVTERGEGLV